MRHSIDKRGRLVIEVDKDEQEAIRELMKRDDRDCYNFDADEVMYDLFEKLVANSELDWIDPSETGDLTSAPMLAIRDYDNSVMKRWGYMAYQVTSPQRDLAEKGYCVWQCP